MTKIKFFLLLSFALGFSSIYAQKTEILNYSLADFDKAQLLYNDKQYLASQILFEKIKQKNNSQEIQADCSYYIAFCAIKLNQSNADELMEQFVENYPTSTKQNQAFIGVSQYYFEQGNYNKSL
jgi:TolA-binding protein